MSSLAFLVAGDTHLTLPVNVYDANWGFQENTVSIDTIGGRVVQLLSVQVTDLTVETVAGSRRELQRVAEGIRQVMQFHLTTELPAYFKVPSRKWSLRVYVTAMPQMGWDFTATTYPYTLTMAIQEDLNGIKTKQIETAVLQRLATGIGYNPHVHGGDPQGFAKIVKSVTGAAAEAIGPMGGTNRQGPGLYHGNDASGAGTKENWKGKNLWPGPIANAPWQGGSLRDQIYNAWASVFDAHTATIMACVAGREAGYHPDAFNQTGYTDQTTGLHHWVYGLYQISDVHNAASWWPKGVAPGSASRSQAQASGGLLFDAEYNTRCAMTMAKARGDLGDWASTTGQCGV